jgi:uncharacterized zinc-type alcohol dehydrogenase-like protein
MNLMTSASHFATPSYAAMAAGGRLQPFPLERRRPGRGEIAIRIQYCGICHSDLHQLRDEWGGAMFPMVAGHEIVGKVTEAGADATKFQPGDTVGVGCMVDSCRECASCREGLEQFCENGSTLTYNARDRNGNITYGGYSGAIVVDEAFALRVTHPEEKLAGAAPLLCAGITTYSPLRYWNVGAGTRVGVAGLGGLGHMAIQLAHAMSAEVTLFTRSAGKAEEAHRLGAHAVVLTGDAGAMAAQQRRLDFLIDTISAPHDVNAYLSLVRRDGAVVLVGAPSQPLQVAAFPLILGRRTLAGSLIGGIAETQVMLDFCAARGITSMVETIPIQAVNDALERLARSEVKYRFVIDMKSLAADATA